MRSAALLAAGMVLSPIVSAAQSNDAGAFARAVTTVKAGRSCFNDTLQVTGTVVPRNEVLVRSDREGSQISQVLVENGDTVASGQVLARLRQPDGQRGSGDVAVQAPAAGVIYSASALIGGTVGAGHGPLFRIARQGEMDLVGETPVDSMTRLSPDLAATVDIVGIGEMAGKVRLIATTVNPATQQGQVRIALGADPRIRVGVFGKASIQIAQRCGPALPLSAVLYGAGGQIVQVVRNDRVETRRVVVGILRGGEAEIREGISEGDVAVLRAGAFVRDGDRVLPVAGTQQPASR
jgi:multidrug efflux pump subunit AcrA (membrane-fusion protein)